MKGIIYKVDGDGRFAFVRADNGTDLLALREDVTDGTKLERSIRVEFSVERSDNGRRDLAVNVARTGRDSVQHDASPSQTAAEPPTRRGWVKSLVPERGYGFVSTSENRRGWFFHFRTLRDAGIRPSEAVEFELGMDIASGRTEAQNVRRVSAGASNEREMNSE